jgi:hypothetical protein
MKYKLLLLAAAFCAMAFSQVKNLTGSWVGRLARPNSTDTATFTYDLKQTDAALAGSLIGPDGGAVEVDNGRVAGNTFSFNITEAYGEAKIEGIYYGDSIGTNILFPNGKVIHLRLIRSK